MNITEQTRSELRDMANDAINASFAAHDERLATIVGQPKRRSNR